MYLLYIPTTVWSPFQELLVVEIKSSVNRLATWSPAFGSVRQRSLWGIFLGRRWSWRQWRGRSTEAIIFHTVCTSCQSRWPTYSWDCIVSWQGRDDDNCSWNLGSLGGTSDWEGFVMVWLLRSGWSQSEEPPEAQLSADAGVFVRPLALRCLFWHFHIAKQC